MHKLSFQDAVELAARRKLTCIVEAASGEDYKRAVVVSGVLLAAEASVGGSKLAGRQALEADVPGGAAVRELDASEAVLAAAGGGELIARVSRSLLQEGSTLQPILASSSGLLLVYSGDRVELYRRGVLLASVRASGEEGDILVYRVEEPERILLSPERAPEDIMEAILSRGPEYMRIYSDSVLRRQLAEEHGNLAVSIALYADGKRTLREILEKIPHAERASLSRERLLRAVSDLIKLGVLRVAG